MTGLEFPLIGWIVIVLCALMVGISKTSIAGLGSLAVAGFALFIAPRESTAAVLLILIVGDIVAVTMYRRSADWTMLRGLLPAVLPGVILGTIVMAFIDDRAMALLIAACILIALAIQMVMRKRAVGTAPPTGPPHLAATVGTGVAAGFTTMVANAAGPVMALYLLAARVDKMKFVGTIAWYFLIVNVSKIPFSVGLGLMTWDTVLLTLILTPAVLLGTFIGIKVLRRLGQARFEQFTIAASVAAGLLLLARGLIGN